MKWFSLSVVFAGQLLLAQTSEPYHIRIIQNETIFDVVNDSSWIDLSRKPFKIEVALNTIEGVFVSCSFDTMYFSVPPDADYPDQKWLTSKTMSEENFNTDRDIITSPEYICYWGYDPELNWYRFDSTLTIEGQNVTGTMTVENIRFQETEIVEPIKEIRNTLYLVFFLTTIAEGNFDVLAVTDRKKVALRFN